jgi:hypothetical protein
MTLAEKIVKFYPELEGQLFINIGIDVRNDSDGRGDYIALWNHPTLAKPTQEQLDSVEE